MLRVYTFGLTGASPHDGEITVISHDVVSATQVATDYVDKYNEENPFCGELKFNPNCVGIKKFEPDQVILFTSGEM